MYGIIFCLATVTLQLTAAQTILGGPMTGTITNGATGLPESGVLIKFHYAVMDENGATPNKTGLVAGSTLTKADGTYNITLPGACMYDSWCQYTAELTKTNFFTTFLMTSSFNGDPASGQDWHVQPFPVDTKMRVVLTWTALQSQPTLWANSAPAANGSKTTVYFANPGHSTAAPFMTLSGAYDSFFGPQVITIEPTATGSWTYMATDTATSGMALAKSGIQVRVFKGKTQVKSYSAPQKVGNHWTVFSMNAGVITLINTMATLNDLPQEWTL